VPLGVLCKLDEETAVRAPRPYCYVGGHSPRVRDAKYSILKLEWLDCCRNHSLSEPRLRVY
jgi:hypothetical protein